MNIFKATANFEHWLARQLPIIRQDLALKHQHKAEAEFPFFRATFYRWLQLWPELCGHLAKAPAVLGVGDLHIENFGTWRDEEGRLIWGVNDLDEAWPAPYTLDLVRLTNSVYVAIGEEHLNLTKRVAAEAIRVIVTPWPPGARRLSWRSEEHTSELQSQSNIVCRLLLEKKKKQNSNNAVLIPRFHASCCDSV